VCGKGSGALHSTLFGRSNCVRLPYQKSRLPQQAGFSNLVWGRRNLLPQRSRRQLPNSSLSDQAHEATLNSWQPFHQWRSLKARDPFMHAIFLCGLKSNPATRDQDPEQVHLQESAYVMAFLPQLCPDAHHWQAL
jgi:hypothetical protein